jgi:hypothetical protein
LLEAQSPGFVPQLDMAWLVAALATSAASIYALRQPPRMPVGWLAGVTLAWGAAMTLWLPWLDHAKTYRGVIEEMKTHAASGCIAARGLTEPQRAMFHYFAGVKARAGECPNLLVHTGEGEPPQVGGGWTLAWRGTRPGDNKEFFWLFKKG